MDRTQAVTLTNMCMICRGSQVLVQEKTDDEWPGIVFPGGHVEKGEPFTDAVIREVYEETGLTISSPQLCGVKDWIEDDGSRYMVLLYKAEKFSGEVRSSDEGVVYWVEQDELIHMKLASGMHDLIRVFCDESISEFFFFQDSGEWKHVLK